jgi:hypothetical protein
MAVAPPGVFRFVQIAPFRPPGSTRFRSLPTEYIQVASHWVRIFKMARRHRLLPDDNSAITAKPFPLASFFRSESGAGLAS